MDGAVAIVETYLRLNGYFTVTEFPVVELAEGAGYRTATDLDILAVRFPTARRLVPGESRGKRERSLLDQVLEAKPDDVDMIVGEVKESSAEFNPAGLRRDVLGAVLARFGCCPAEASDTLVRRLVEQGRAHTHAGHEVRMIAFGGRVGGRTPYLQIPLGHVVRFVTDYVHEHRTLLRNVQSKDPALGFLILMEKLGAGGGG
jgi:hypothetical protein